MEDDRYFGDGITDEIITGLSRNRSLYVIARGSTLRYRDRAQDLNQIGGELDVRYLLDLTVQRQGTRLRINTELIDIPLNRSVWSQRFEWSTEEIFEFQDRISASIFRVARTTAEPARGFAGSGSPDREFGCVPLRSQGAFAALSFCGGELPGSRRVARARRRA